MDDIIESVALATSCPEPELRTDRYCTVTGFGAACRASVNVYSVYSGAARRSMSEGGT